MKFGPHEEALEAVRQRRARRGLGTAAIDERPRVPDELGIIWRIFFELHPRRFTKTEFGATQRAITDADVRDILWRYGLDDDAEIRWYLTTLVLNLDDAWRRVSSEIERKEAGGKGGAENAEPTGGHRKPARTRR